MEIRTRDQALSLGLKHYYTGKPCKRGHAAPRYVSTGACTRCQGAATSTAHQNRNFRLAGFTTISARVPPHLVDAVRAMLHGLGVAIVGEAAPIVAVPPAGTWVVPPPPNGLDGDVPRLTVPDDVPKLYVPNSGDYSLD
jgi:hypothetical protein